MNVKLSRGLSGERGRTTAGLLAQDGSSFDWARRLLGARHAAHATRLYGFCRRLDDAVDEATDVTMAHGVLTAIRHALQTGRSDDPAVVDMLQLMQTCQISPIVPLDLLNGIESDLGVVRCADMEALLHYCYQVAGTVGLMMTSVLDVADRSALPHAVDLGMALQLTNICRDVRQDALLGRRYLPATLVGTLEPADLVNPSKGTRRTVMHALDLLLQTAERYYASGERGLHYLPPGARPAILVAARTYRGIGTALRSRGLDCWSTPASVSVSGRVAITLGALCRAAVGPLRHLHSISPLEPGCADRG